MTEEPKAHVNPPLTALNAAAREAAEATRREQAEIQARMGLRESGARRVVKPLTPPKGKPE